MALNGFIRSMNEDSRMVPYKMPLKKVNMCKIGRKCIEHRRVWCGSEETSKLITSILIYDGALLNNRQRGMLTAIELRGLKAVLQELLRRDVMDVNSPPNGYKTIYS
jgi:hypothetical protein